MILASKRQLSQTISNNRIRRKEIVSGKMKTDRLKTTRLNLFKNRCGFKRKLPLVLNLAQTIFKNRLPLMSQSFKNSNSLRKIVRKLRRKKLELLRLLVKIHSLST